MGVILGGYLMTSSQISRIEALSKSMISYLHLFSHVMFFLCNWFLLLTAWSDPGIVKATELYGMIDEEEASRERLPYCSVCNIHQPPRLQIYHCEECGYCIEKMDHHCPWMVSALIS